MSMLGESIGNYRITRQIGQGGMGTVYEAVHTSIRQRAAVKVLAQDLIQDQDALRRFFTEARVLSSLDHPAIVRVFDFGKRQDGMVYMMMEYLVGETLHERLERNVGRLPVGDAMRLVRQIAQALDAAHQRGILHRDIKPGNVFIVSDPEMSAGERIKLLDFGVAKLLAGSGLAEADPAGRTQAGMVLGTPFYMSPEQCQGHVVSEKSDVYSLGVLLFRVLTGKVPFESKNETEVYLAHIQKEPPSMRQLVPSLPERIDGLVQAMLFKEPRLRPSMSQVVSCLKDLEAMENADRTFFGDMDSIDMPALPPPLDTPTVGPASYAGIDIEFSPSFIATGHPGQTQLARPGRFPLWALLLLGVLLSAAAFLVLHRVAR